mgnify:CR=1 FL=1
MLPVSTSVAVTVVTAVVFSATLSAALTPPPSLVISGASLTAVTVTSTPSVAVENAAAPPLLPVSTFVPATPLVQSHARSVNAAALVPL